MKKFASSLSLSLATLAISANQAFAAVGDPGDPIGGDTGDGIRNPLLPNISVQDSASGEAFTQYLVYFWRVIITFGMLAVLIIFIMGAFDWLNAGSDKGKIDSARQKIINAVIGAILLVGTFAIIGFIGRVFNFDLLKLDITPLVPN